MKFFIMTDIMSANDGASDLLSLNALKFMKGDSFRHYKSTRSTTNRTCMQAASLLVSILIENEMVISTNLS